MFKSIFVLVSILTCLNVYSSCQKAESLIDGEFVLTDMNGGSALNVVFEKTDEVNSDFGDEAVIYNVSGFSDLPKMGLVYVDQDDISGCFLAFYNPSNRRDAAFKVEKIGQDQLTFSIDDDGFKNEAGILKKVTE